MTIYTNDNPAPTAELELHVETIEEVIAPGFTLNHNETVDDERKTPVIGSRLKNLARSTAGLLLLVATTFQGWPANAKTETMVKRRSNHPINAPRPNSMASGVAHSAVTPTLTPAQIEAAVEEYFASVASRDVERFANNYATDGVLEDPVGTPPIEGQQAIAAVYAAGIAAFSEIKATVQEVIVGGNEAIVNWKIKVKTIKGKQITVDGMGLFKFNAAGKLLAVREFFDLAAFLAQLQD
jgi:uncharacterized protein (TIGR02246 family)